MALALVLLAGAGLLLRSFANIRQLSPGFDPRGLITAEVRIPVAQGATPAGMENQWIQFHRLALEKLKALPGVTGAALCVTLPFSGSDGTSSFAIQGRERRPGDPGPHRRSRWISPEYFSTLGVPVLRGRAFTEQDRMGAEPVAVIDDNLARQYWPNEDPVGKYLIHASNRPPIRIVGIVGNVKQTDLAADINKGIRYLPMYQRGLPFGGYVLRTAGDPLPLGQGIRAAIQAVEPSQPVHNIESMEQKINVTLAPRRFVLALVGAFAALAVLLACVGLYGVISYSVSQRTQEIGVRMALGAQPWRVVRLVVSQGMRMVAAGVAPGLLLALSLSRSLTAQLNNVSPLDPLTFVAVAILLTGVALLACLVPALRAARIDPWEAIRYE